MRRPLDLKAAKQAAYKLLKCRDRSEKEICQRLKLKGFSQEVIRQAVEHLYKLNYLDDRRFAKAWVASRLNKPLGIRRIVLELKQKGIGQDLINEVLAEISPTYDEHSAAWDLLKAKFKNLKMNDDDQLRRRIFSFLIRRGFSLSTATQIIEELK
ncbi:MAG: regulatory protein RecX [Candidatus Omnitrophota bacterium]